MFRRYKLSIKNLIAIENLVNPTDYLLLATISLVLKLFCLNKMKMRYHFDPIINSSTQTLDRQKRLNLVKEDHESSWWKRPEATTINR